MDLLDDLGLEFEDKLSLGGTKERRLEDEDSWLFVPEEGKKEAGKKTAEEQNLEKWLRGAVDKVDYRTRSALSRRLEKKKRRADKERRLRNNNMESSLSMIEEVSSESGPMSDREQRMRPREKENMAARKAISEASVCSEDDEDEEDEEEYFDAPSTPKKMSQLRTMAAKQQQSPGRTPPRTPPRTLNATSGGRNMNNNKNTITLGRRTRKPMMRRDEEEAEEQQQMADIEVPTEWRDLSDIERRAKEQEKELQMELMRNRRERLSQQTHAPASVGGGTRSRPNSASSSNSSVLSGGANASHAHTPHHMATSKSVDFRASSGHIADHSSVASSRSNEGSLADLNAGTSDILNHPSNSRLPLPRRPTIPGKTGIPLPAPSKRQPKMTLPPPKRDHELEQLDDEDYF